MMRDRIRDALVLRGGLLALVTLLLYGWVAPHHVVDGDNAEFATLSVTGGAAHPTGYPLYVLYLRALSWLPGASPAHTAALATALLGAATVLVLHAACRAWGARPFAATVAVALFACGPVVMRVVTEAEVFALNNLVVATVLWLAAANGPLRGARRGFGLGLVAGLGLADHVTCVLVAPVGLLGVARALRESSATRTALLATGGLVLGLTPYAYLVLAPDTPLAWGKVRDMHGVIAMFLREDYGGPTSFLPGRPTVPPLTNLGGLARTVGRAWLWLPALAGLAMLAIRCVRRMPQVEPRAGWVALALSWLIAGPILVLRFNVPPEGLGLYVCQRFHMLPALLLAIPVAHALDRVTVPRATLATALAGSLGVIGLASLSLPYVGRVHSPAVETAAKNMLRTLPPNAVVIHGQDELHAVTGYVQWALGERQDVVVVTWPLMTHSWYGQRIGNRGVAGDQGPGGPQTNFALIQLMKDRPVFVDRLQVEVIGSLFTYPCGTLLCVLKPNTRVPSVREVFELNEALYARYTLDYAVPGPHDEFATAVHRRYRDTWTMLETAMQRAGDVERANRARAYAEALGPRAE